jgi:hypothetical protein
MVTKKQTLVAEILDNILADRYPVADQLKAGMGLRRATRDQLEAIKRIVQTVGCIVIMLLTACTKEPIYYDPNCGVIESKVYEDDICIVTYLWNTGERETVEWHFEIESGVGDTICKMQELDINEICKP